MDLGDRIVAFWKPMLRKTTEDAWLYRASCRWIMFSYFKWMIIKGLKLLKGSLMSWAVVRVLAGGWDMFSHFHCKFTPINLVYPDFSAHLIGHEKILLLNTGIRASPGTASVSTEWTYALPAARAKAPCRGRRFSGFLHRHGCFASNLMGYMQHEK